MINRRKSSILDREDFDAGPTNLDCIEDNLWLGNLTAATDISNLLSKNINYILTLDSCPLPRKITELKDINVLFVKVTDTPKEDIISHFEKTYQFIDEGRKNGVVLVHCYFGVSRSATVIIAYLMKHHGITMEEAINLAKSKRRFIGPNPGFLAQLQLYESMGCGVDTSNLQYRMFRLHITADQVAKVKILPQACVDVLKPDPALVRVRPDPKGFRCRKCRRIVALASNVLPHSPKKKYSWKDAQWSQSLDKVDLCTQTYFVEPLAWMQGVTASIEGKIHCPQCQSKLGSYSWTMGCECPCGTRVCPAFYLVPSKVDKSNCVQNVQVTV